MRSTKAARRYHLTHARLAAEVRKADERASAYSTRAADVALMAVFAGLLFLATQYIGG